MSNLEDFNAQLEALKALDPKEVKEPNMPVDIFVQEGENLVHWCQADKDALVKASLDWTLVDNLPVQLGALREAQSQWQTEKDTQEAAGREWKEKAPHAFDLRDTLVHDFLYAYRKQSDVLARVQEIADGGGNADLVQDLNDLSVLGKAHPTELEAISFDLTRLDTAATLSDELGNLLALVNGERQTDNKAKDIRDRAYTLCKDAISEIRETGQYVFWRNPDRAKGYASAYNRTHNQKQAKKSDEPVL